MSTIAWTTVALAGNRGCRALAPGYGDPSVPLDVWLKFDADDGDEASHEANTYYRDGEHVVEWYHTAVGQISRRVFRTYGEARAWLESEGFSDYTT